MSNDNEGNGMTETQDTTQEAVAVEDRFPKLSRKLRARAEQDPQWAQYAREVLSSPTDQGVLSDVAADIRDEQTADEIYNLISGKLVDWGQQTDQGMALTALAVIYKIGEFIIGVTQDEMRDDYEDRIRAADKLVAVAHEVSKVGVTGGLSTEQLDKLNAAIDEYDRRDVPLR